MRAIKKIGVSEPAPLGDKVNEIIDAVNLLLKKNGKEPNKEEVRKMGKVSEAAPIEVAFRPNAKWEIESGKYIQKNCPDFIKFAFWDPRKKSSWRNRECKKSSFCSNTKMDACLDYGDSGFFPSCDGRFYKCSVCKKMYKWEISAHKCFLRHENHGKVQPKKVI